MLNIEILQYLKTYKKQSWSKMNLDVKVMQARNKTYLFSLLAVILGKSHLPQTCFFTPQINIRAPFFNVIEELEIMHIKNYHRTEDVILFIFVISIHVD